MLQMHCFLTMTWFRHFCISALRSLVESSSLLICRAWRVTRRFSSLILRFCPWRVSMALATWEPPDTSAASRLIAVAEAANNYSWHPSAPPGWSELKVRRVPPVEPVAGNMFIQPTALATWNELASVLRLSMQWAKAGWTSKLLQATALSCWCDAFFVVVRQIRKSCEKITRIESLWAA